MSGKKNQLDFFAADMFLERRTHFASLQIHSVALLWHNWIMGSIMFGLRKVIL